MVPSIGGYKRLLSLYSNSYFLLQVRVPLSTDLKIIKLLPESKFGARWSAHWFPGTEELLLRKCI